MCQIVKIPYPSNIGIINLCGSSLKRERKKMILHYLFCGSILTTRCYLREEILKIQTAKYFLNFLYDRLNKSCLLQGFKKE